MALGGNQRGNRWAGLLLVGALLCLPRLSWATCGDYLQMPEHAGAKSVEHQSGSPSPVTPCRGPRCRGSLPPTSPPAPFSIDRPSDHWACADLASAVQPQFSQRCESVAGVHRVDGFQLRIERPPR